MNIEKLQINSLPLYYFESIDSTSTYARNIEIQKEALVIAECQTGGRGRIGHDFYSPKGGMYFSYAFKDDRLLSDLTLEMGKIVLKYLMLHSSSAGDAETLSIRGVNDIFLGNKKICGILCEHISDRYIIGIGINTADCLFPEELQSIAGHISVDSAEDLLVETVEAIRDYLRKI